MENSLETINVLDLLPQRPPFIMIDKLVFSDEVVTTTKFLVRSDNIFMEGDVLNACALVENIAQTCAARMGYINYVNHEKVRIGFIGSVRNLNILRPVRLGELLTTSIEVKEEVMQLTLVEASVRVGDETVVTAEMKIALSDIVAQG
ncbi:MAG: pseudouridylate synthase [Prevotella sp.]|nr:pseudouridylate synthase [Prevotella sp.]